MSINGQNFIDKFDREFIRIGSSRIGVETQGSDYDYAVPRTIWNQMASILLRKYGFTDCEKSSGSRYGSHHTEMFNVTNVKMKYGAYTFDFVVYDDEDMIKVESATNNFVEFVESFPSLNTFNDKDVRVGAFQYFLRKAFGVGTQSPTKETQELDDLFDGFSKPDAMTDEEFFDALKDGEDD